MRFDTTPEFDGDFRRLKDEHRAAFRAVVRARFVPACDAWAAAQVAGGVFVWPRALRVSPLRGRSDVWEMTWSFASPDGRATFQFVRVGDAWVCRWRRVGDHGVFRSP